MLHAPTQAKARLAYVPDNCLLFPEMTGRGLLEEVAADKNVALDQATLSWPMTWGWSRIWISASSRCRRGLGGRCL